MNDLIKSVGNGLSKMKFGLAKKAPDIKFVAGVGGVITGTVLACVATKKLDPILDNHKKALDDIHAKRDALSEEDKLVMKDQLDREIAKTYLSTGKDILKLYALPTAIEVASIVSLTSAHKDLKDDNAVLASMFATNFAQFKEYRNTVKEKLGEEAEKEIFHGIVEEEVEEKVTDADGFEVVEKHTVKTSRSYKNGYSFFFDSSSPYWEDDPNYNLMFLRSQERFANDLIQKRARDNGGRGFLFLNEVLQQLSPNEPLSKMGQKIGWVYDEKNPVGDNYVDFGIFYSDSEATKRFLRGLENVVLLDFNCDGNIWDLM